MRSSRVEHARRSRFARAAARPRSGELRRARPAARRARRGDGVTGRGEAGAAGALRRRPGRARSRAALDALRRRCSRERAPDAPGRPLLDACRAERRPARRRWPRSTWRCGTARAAAPGAPVAALLTDEPLARVAVNATIGAAGPRGRRGARPRAARGGLRLREAQGRRRRRRGPRRRRARRASGPRSRCGWTPTAPGRRRGGRAHRARSPAGLELVEEPVHGVEELRAVRERVAVADRDGRDRAPSRARAAAGADAVCLKISRCGGIAGAAAEARSRARRAPRSTSPRPSTARSGSRRPSTPRRRCASDRCSPAAWRRSAHFDATPEPVPRSGSRGDGPLPGAPPAGPRPRRRVSERRASRPVTRGPAGR